MKSTTFAVLASATLVMATPKFLNNAGDFENIEAGDEFPIKYSGCDSGCTITLETGPSDALKPVTTLAADASGDSITVTIPEDLASADYAFRIVDNSDNDPETNHNFSKQFPVEGSAAASSSAASSSAAATSSAASSSSASSAASSAASSEAETSSASETSSAVETTSVTVSSQPLTTPAPSSTEISTSTKSATSTSTSTTNVPDSAAAGYQAQLGLVMAAAVAIAAL
jgi:hypothetical protein